MHSTGPSPGSLEYKHHQRIGHQQSMGRRRWETVEVIYLAQDEPHVDPPPASPQGGRSADARRGPPAARRRATHRQHPWERLRQSCSRSPVQGGVPPSWSPRRRARCRRAATPSGPHELDHSPAQWCRRGDRHQWLRRKRQGLQVWPSEVAPRGRYHSRGRPVLRGDALIASNCGSRSQGDTNARKGMSGKWRVKNPPQAERLPTGLGVHGRRRDVDRHHRIARAGIVPCDSGSSTCACATWPVGGPGATNETIGLAGATTRARSDDAAVGAATARRYAGAGRPGQATTRGSGMAVEDEMVVVVAGRNCSRPRRRACPGW